MEPSFRLKLQVITDCDCNMSAKNPNTSTSAKGKDKATGPGANDPAATPENALVFLQKCIDIFSNCTPVMPVLEKLGQAMRDNENLKGHLDTIEKEMRDNEMNLRKTIEQKEAALIEARKGLLDSVWKDFSAKHDSTAKLKEKDQEMQQKLQEKDREISKLMAKHQSELTTQKKHLEEQGTKQQNELKRQIVRLTNEKEEAARDLEESRSLIERMNTEQQETTMLLNAAGVRERARERELATMQEEMGLKEVADDELSVIYLTICPGSSR
ncbi:MAG: hypothetical protein QOD07_3199 [Frankiaceae bacterium]|nr:hypothetical protein [Frankiaceae bacterium]